MSAVVETLIRTHRAVGVVHAEAFQLMLYKAKDGCELWFWNSRDGVTPFGTVVDGKEMLHAMNEYHAVYQAILPTVASHVWVSHDQVSWAQMQTANYDRFSRPDQPYAKDFIDRYPRLADWHRVTPFEWGQPRQITREEYLKSTPEFYGKPEVQL